MSSSKSADDSGELADTVRDLQRKLGITQQALWEVREALEDESYETVGPRGRRVSIDVSVISNILGKPEGRPAMTDNTDARLILARRERDRYKQALAEVLEWRDGVKENSPDVGTQLLDAILAKVEGGSDAN